MDWYRNTSKIKTALLLSGIALVVIFIFYTQNIVKELRQDNKEIVKLYAELIAETAAQEGDENLNFIFKNIIQNIQFPIIQTDLSGRPVSWRNIEFTKSDTTKILDAIEMMDKQNEPIALYFLNPATNDSIVFGNLHYGDSKLINRLVWLPIQETMVISIFIMLGFIAFTIIRNSEKRYIWIGMAKETAHQLGTPVSALLGWVDRIKSNPDDVVEIAVEMDKDLNRLQQISERFGDMSSSPTLKETLLFDLMQGVIDYLKVRLPSSGDIKISNTIKPEVKVNVHPGLFAWAVENIIRNAIDAMDNIKGNIDIWSVEEQGVILLYIKDNGPGIIKNDWKNIFRPGYSTKLHGWGLGLSLTKRIIKDLNKADVFVKSSSARTGTTIGISIENSNRSK